MACTILLYARPAPGALPARSGLGKQRLDIPQQPEVIADREQADRGLQMIGAGRRDAAGDDLELIRAVRQIPQAVGRMARDTLLAIVVTLALGPALQEVRRGGALARGKIINLDNGRFVIAEISRT